MVHEMYYFDLWKETTVLVYMLSDVRINRSTEINTISKNILEVFF